MKKEECTERELDVLEKELADIGCEGLLDNIKAFRERERRLKELSSTIKALEEEVRGLGHEMDELSKVIGRIIGMDCRRVEMEFIAEANSLKNWAKEMLE